MHDAPFYLSMFAASAIIAQIPEVQQFQDFSATVILGILFWYTLTRVNGGIAKLTEAIAELRETLLKEADQRREHETDKD
ncbi:MAG: hypothetical protein IJQ31_14885 [Thermoguttaceae bacterium]|nr:hypothetical protein [Thermoguttaceae bacterium]